MVKKFKGNRPDSNSQEGISSSYILDEIKKRQQSQYRWPCNEFDLAELENQPEPSRFIWPESQAPPPLFLRWNQLLTLIPVGKSTIQRWMQAKSDPFPAPQYIKRTALFSTPNVASWLQRNFSDSHATMVNFKHRTPLRDN